MSGQGFDDDFRAGLGRLLRWRRDVRRFRREPLPQGCLERLLDAAQLAPSVGLSQPWRWVLVESEAARDAVAGSFRSCNARALGCYEGERASAYARLKLSGLEEAPVQLSVFCDTQAPAGHGLGRHSMPGTLDYSVVLAIHTLWLAARAEGVGVGWVSILDPDEMARALDVPPGWRFVAHLCVGWPDADDAVPELERLGWEKRAAWRESLLRR